MKCPHCVDVVLVMTERQGVEIDYCPQCRGVWLDRGELDKLIERSAAPAASAPAVPPRRPGFVDSGYGYTGHGKRKYKSWLSEIFD
ncbi:TFIIB-type zinc ribbon-containing protein [Hydrogenophaga aquatica]